jgi:transposase
VGNAHDMRPRPGKKTDKADARWIAELLAQGLIRPRFVPPPAIRALRDLPRTRVGFVQTRTQAKNRGQKVLEDSNIKRASVASDVCGTSGRRMLEALIAGECDAQKLASMARGRLRRKLPERERALTGQCTAHHGRMIALALELIDLLARQIADLNEQIGLLVAPLQAHIAQLDSMPGVDGTAARDILGEMGTDMRRFGSAARLSSWARMSPGNNERAGKRRLLVQGAWAARKTPTFLGCTLRRLAARIGGKRAAVAIGHKMLVLVYHLLLAGTCYEAQRYADQQPQQEERERKRAIKALDRLGYSVTVERVA